MLGVGASEKTYVDEVFSNYLWNGTSSARSINNGINLSESGGMTWIKKRSGSDRNVITDTVRGKTKQVFTERTDGNNTSSNYITAFNTNGFSLGTDNRINHSGDTYTSQTFRKTEGFFDVVSYTGNSSNRTIAHSLASIPGMILIKETSNPKKWVVYHRSIGPTNILELNTNSASGNFPTNFNSTVPTSTHFSLGGSSHVNGNGETYVAYLFAGGESTAATARSVDFSGSSDEIFENTTSSVLRNWFDQAFTVEYWVKADALASGDGGGTNAVGVSTLGTGNLSWSFGPNNTGQIRFSYWTGSNESTILPSETIKVGQWYHLAFVHDGSDNCKIFINGTLGKEATISNGTANAGDMVIGQVQNTQFNGKVSNLRITHQALYTTSFRPPTEPLTTTSQGATASNVKLLCCNNSSVTGNTVSPSGLGNNGSPTASTDSPFDDPAGFVFGDSKEGIIKTGSYVGNGSATGPEINLGWEPQWLMIKNTGASEHWSIFDSMRGLVTGGNDEHIKASSADSEYSSHDWMSLTPTGFKINTTAGEVNQDGKTHIFIAIRRPDGYVGKPAKLGTDVFAMDTGSSSSTIPTYDSGFPVDWALRRAPASTSDFISYQRLLGLEYVVTNSNSAETTSDKAVWDSNVGFFKTDDSSKQAWMWKRHAGFDVVTYKGVSNTQHLNHSLGRIPEMIWIKNRTYTTWFGNNQDWLVYHKGLNGGTNPEQYILNLNGTSAEANESNFADTAPTAVQFSVGSDTKSSYASADYIAMLFASVDGISKVGSYTGNGASSQTITTGFQPRFIIIKNIDQSGKSWMVLDTVRGWASGNDNYLQLNDSAAQLSHDFGNPTSTGFYLHGGGSTYNGSGTNYIYYAHA